MRVRVRVRVTRRVRSFEPFLRRAVQSSMKKFHKEYASERRVDKEFFVSFYNLPAILKVRDLRSERIGRLVAITGTVTRTSEVRPELLYGTFLCQECGQTEDNVEQQFKYTEPTRCLNERCNNTNKWTVREAHGGGGACAGVVTVAAGACSC